MTMQKILRLPTIPLCGNRAAQHAASSHLRLLRTCACGMIAATAFAKSNNQAAIRDRR